MSSKRNHHLQPNFYLKGFKSPDKGNPKIWVYEKGKPFNDGKTEQLQNPKHLTTEKAARKKDFYSFFKEDGTREHEKYENLLMKYYEQPTDIIIEKIRSFENIEETEKVILSRYIASMRTRSDKWREVFLNDVLRLTENDIENWDSNQFPNDDIEEVRKFVKHTFLSNKEKLHKESIISVAEKIASMLINMEWRFLVMPDKLNLFTSDNPVVYFNIDEIKGQLIFPVSSKVAISIIHKGFKEPRSWKKLNGRYWKVDDRTVALIRNDIAVAAIKYVYFSEKKEWIVDFINNRNNN